jgi:hypothetical protein
VRYEPLRGVLGTTASNPLSPAILLYLLYFYGYLNWVPDAADDDSAGDGDGHGIWQVN